MPLALAWDFNATRAPPVVRAPASGFPESGPTWGPVALGTRHDNAMVRALAAIDHVLVSGFAAVGSGRLMLDGTDHSGIMAKFASCRSSIGTSRDKISKEDVTNHPAWTLTTWFRDDASVR